MTTDPSAHFNAMATMRRTAQMMQMEMQEFFAASMADQREAMQRSRNMAHEYLDAYFDATYAAGTVNHGK